MRTRIISRVTSEKEMVVVEFEDNTRVVLSPKAARSTAEALVTFAAQVESLYPPPSEKSTIEKRPA